MSQEEGQADEQPSNEDTVAAALSDYLDKTEFGEDEKKEEEPKAEADEEPSEESHPEEKKEEPAIEIDPEVPLFDLTVKDVGGTDVQKKVSLKELQSGYMMQADYQRKTAEIAKQRAELANEIKAKTEPVVQNYEKQLQVLSTVVSQIAAPELQNVNWLELAKSDPAKFVEMKARADQVNSVLQGITAEQQKLMNQRAQEAQQARDRAAQEAVEVLRRDIPGWNQDKYQSILKGSIEKYGFKPEEVTQVVDPRLVKVLNDALAYQELKSGKPLAEKKVIAKPKVVRPGSPDKDSDQIADRKKEALTKLRKSGDVEDAAAALFNMIQ